MSGLATEKSARPIGEVSAERATLNTPASEMVSEASALCRRANGHGEMIGDVGERAELLDRGDLSIGQKRRRHRTDLGLDDAVGQCWSREAHALVLDGEYTGRRDECSIAAGVRRGEICQRQFSASDRHVQLLPTDCWMMLGSHPPSSRFNPRQANGPSSVPLNCAVSHVIGQSQHTSPAMLT